MEETTGRVSPGAVADAAADRLARMAHDRVVERIWGRDHTVWADDPTEISDRLGWLDVMDAMRERVPELEAFAKEITADGVDHVVLLGMGGSSLAPEVLATVFRDAGLPLSILDTTHPAAIAGLEQDTDLDRALFVVASKSGTTIETRSQLDHFWELTDAAGGRFVAITDAGTPLDELAGERRFRAVFRNPEDIGGRYSALSLFGLVPGALVGAPLADLLAGASEMAEACRADDDENPGAWLGAILGEAALHGQDKLTLVLPERAARLGIEQLVAESTGKRGVGILPVVGEGLGPADAYGGDRLFVGYGDDDRLTLLEAAGQPVVRLPEHGASALGAEMFRWEFATAVAGHVLGINPFDQPDVAAAKEATAAILEEGLREPGMDALGAVLDSAGPGDYVAILAYLDPTPEAAADLHRARVALRDRSRVATTVGFGPRYLHSTGQLHKGGPPTGVFIQVVDEDRVQDEPIPGQAYTFGTLIDAQALGDLRSLRARGRRVARTTLDRLLEEV
jgi:transaldolase / glucose-6-phosphate isomerase